VNTIRTEELIHMASSGVKDFYRQKKKGGVTKASASSKKKTQKYTGGTFVGAPDATQTSALVSHGSWDLKGTCRRDRGVPLFKIFSAQLAFLRYCNPFACGKLVADNFGDQEEQLRQFDMDMKFGPCIGVTRLQRWERASSMGLQPPPHVRDLLLRTSSTKTRGSVGGPSPECLWEGKV
jgi:DNA polymerase delta subunit 4